MTEQEVKYREQVKQYHCQQCGRELSALEYIVLGPVCGVCCRKNHKRVTEGRSR